MRQLFRIDTDKLEAGNITVCRNVFFFEGMNISSFLFVCDGNKLLGEKKKSFSGGFVLYEQIRCTIVIVSNYC